MYDHDPLTQQIIGCAIEVHRHLGPGLLEATYEEALCIELADAGLAYNRQLRVPVLYKDRPIGEYRPDLVVDGRVLVEMKSVESLHQAAFGAGACVHACAATVSRSADELQQRRSSYEHSQNRDLKVLGVSEPRWLR